MSSPRTKLGTCPPVPWHCPQRFDACRLSQTLSLNACTSWLAGGGPVYPVGGGGVVAGFSSVDAPPPQPASASMASTGDKAARKRIRTVALGFIAVPSGALAIRGGVGKCLLQAVAARPERARHRLDLVAIRLVLRRAQANGAEHLLDLAGREPVARAELLAERLGAVAGTRQRRVPAEQRVLTGAPAVHPRVVRRAEAEGERGVVVEVLRLHGAAGVDHAPLRLVEGVVREGLSHRVHARVAADAVIEEQARVASRAPAHVLANAVRRARCVLHFLEVAAHVVEQREAEHGAVRAGDEERLRRGARGQDAGCGRWRRAVGGRLRR